MQQLRMGMIGGGTGAFIGAVHRIAARMDGLIQLTAGAFSSSFEKSIETGKLLGIDANRIYANYEEMILKEANLPENQRIHFISIVTPNHVHFAPAKMAMEYGFDVVLDKPMTFNYEEALQLKAIAEQTNCTFCLTHTYTGYPMVKQAQKMLQSGMFGAIRKVYVEYPQGWLSNALEKTEQKQAAWRTDPTKSGKAGAMGDIGTHAFNLAEYVSGLQVTAICAQVNTVVADRLLDDDGAALLQFNNGATGVLMATQIAAGEENNVKIRVYGEKGGIEWQQQDANTLQVKWLDAPTQIYRAGTGYLSSFASENARTPAGHPEGYLEAFANHYKNFALTVLAKKNNETPTPEMLDFPGIKAGIRGMLFIDKIIESGSSNTKWVEL
jgi:predicted dehydrogenase